jgi:hypothetical protein
MVALTAQARPGLGRGGRTDEGEYHRNENAMNIWQQAAPGTLRVAQDRCVDIWLAT